MSTGRGVRWMPEVDRTAFVNRRASAACVTATSASSVPLPTDDEPGDVLVIVHVALPEADRRIDDDPLRLS
jgi:hypothetical protein